jgi:hypothetical protein
MLCALAAACALVPAANAAAATTTETVTEADIVRQAENTPPTNDWVLYTRNAGNGVFVNGPETPPEGLGSLALTTPTGSDKVFLFNYDHVGTPLSAIDEMGYSTYRDSGASPNQVPAINIEIDENGGTLEPGDYSVLVFEPVYNTGQGTVVDDEWQTWDAYNGGQAIWWSSQPIGGAPNRDTFVTWDTIVAANPNATIIGGFGVNQGSGNPALSTNADALAIGYDGDTTLYDFENRPVSKDDCKKGGWESFGGAFKNQGDCVSYVATKGKNR